VSVSLCKWQHLISTGCHILPTINTGSCLMHPNERKLVQRPGMIGMADVGVESFSGRVYIYITSWRM
jgi:hypothetical protein